MKIPFTNIDTKEHYTEIWLYIIGMSIRAIIMFPFDWLREKIHPTPPIKPWQPSADYIPPMPDPHNTRTTIKFRK